MVGKREAGSTHPGPSGQTVEPSACPRSAEIWKTVGSLVPGIWDKAGWCASCGSSRVERSGLSEVRVEDCSGLLMLWAQRSRCWLDSVHTWGWRPVCWLPSQRRCYCVPKSPAKHVHECLLVGWSFLGGEALNPVGRPPTASPVFQPELSCLGTIVWSKQP